MSPIVLRGAARAHIKNVRKTRELGRREKTITVATVALLPLLSNGALRRRKEEEEEEIRLH